MTPYERARINVTVNEAYRLARDFLLQREGAARAACVTRSVHVPVYHIVHRNQFTWLATYDPSGAILVRRVPEVPASIQSKMLNRLCDALDIPRVFKTVGRIRLNMDGVEMIRMAPMVLAGPIVVDAARYRLLTDEPERV